MALGNELNLSERINGLFTGEIVNVSENRPALHTALRFSEGSNEEVDRVVREEFERASDFSLLVRSGKWVGATGKPINTVINIGIGGHIWGLLWQTLLYVLLEMGQLNLSLYQTLIQQTLIPNFIYLILRQRCLLSIQNPLQLQKQLRMLKLPFIGSKVHLVLRKFLGSIFCRSHCKSQRSSKVRNPERKYLQHMGLGWGRFSICSSVSLAVMISVGPENFQLMLDGANSIDEHFRSTDLSEKHSCSYGIDCYLE